MLLRVKHKRPDLDVDYYPNFLNEELANAWYQLLESIFPMDNSRTSMIFGNEGLIYRVSYRGNTTETEVLPWSDLPGLFELKNLIERVIDQKITVCVIQKYPNGKVGINPHRDKEMVAGTRIAGVSVGAPRSIEFTKLNQEPVCIKLGSGSLYVMNDPTNQRWLHCIRKDSKIKNPRYSFTFRDY